MRGRFGRFAMQIDIEAAARVAPAGVGEPLAADLAVRRMRWVPAVAILAAIAAVLLASCLAVIMSLS
jgi:hypothetical protein